MKIKLNQLNILLEIATQGSMGKAARTLQLTQPAISKAIQEIEAEIGVPILQRTSRGVLLNEYGQVLLRHARDIDLSFQKISDEIEQLQLKAMHQLRLGVTPAATYGPFTQTLLQFQRNYPDVKLTTTESRPGQICEALINQQLDLAVIPRSSPVPATSTLYRETLYALRNDIMAGKQHPVTHLTSLKSLLQYPWLDWGEPDEHSVLNQLCQRYNLPRPASIMHCSSPWLTARMMEQSPMLSIWTAVRLRFPELSRGLRPLALKETLPATCVEIVCPAREHLSTAGTIFTEMLRENTNEWLAGEDAREMVAHV